jgi:predicted oxidoreductase
VTDAYPGALRAGGDFASYYAPDMVRTFMEDGEQAHGREAVRDLVVGMNTGEFAGVPPTGIDVRPSPPRPSLT